MTTFEASSGWAYPDIDPVPPRTIADLDVPAERVAAEVARTAGLLAEQEHQTDPADSLFARLAVAHPEACHTAADYPNWTPGGAA